MTNFKKTYYKMGAMMTLGMTTGLSVDAFAADPVPAANNFGKISENITLSIAELPGLLSAVSYMIGIGLGVLGIIKIKAHVENPGNTDLRSGVIRLAAGGALFALPIVYEAMLNTVGADKSVVKSAQLQRVQFKTE